MTTPAALKHLRLTAEAVQAICARLGMAAERIEKIEAALKPKQKRGKRIARTGGTH